MHSKHLSKMAEFVLIAVVPYYPWKRPGRPFAAQNIQDREQGCGLCLLQRRERQLRPIRGEGAGLDLTDDKVCRRLILKAKQKIERKRTEWEREFVETSKIPFEEAVKQYRKSKNAAST
jgi:hypothetical protein